ncbi:bacterial lantibiotic synthetase component C-like protein [Heterostelium album PN500]|uniref:Bacterial lantibiotic synthetase component C-like protein n=1 Tax=Heterostelium pallidum (strain ATCC 26659 / Pp 5 / PN500) TaxID=670386 RepID=D3BB60_HETP5|nr:bacterial lantibiotic synthetase component C-like protein [Heterostelium album PN500]EFA81797.1 bacterial lantibiotic synthetase component C-like protein [Heterostelium album PN500]|eukprot:XP_020433914.1 bacterial lantibiotic synthetase component C-like protein [Heterostelium album PN500]
MEGRYIDNPYLQSTINNIDKQSLLNEELQSLFSSSLNEIDQQLKDNQPTINKDNTIYTGSLGLCFSYLMRYLIPTSSGNQQPTTYLDLCRDLYNCLTRDYQKKRSSKKRITFLSGDNGLLTIGIILNSLDRDNDKMLMLFKQLLNQLNEIINDDDDDDDEQEYPYELLYGKSGYLQCLLLIKRYCLKNSLESLQLLETLDQSIEALVVEIVESGRDYAIDDESESPLMYEWHRSQYLGGVHGLAGILYMLMSSLEMISINQEKKRSIDSDIRESLDYLVSTMLPSGNFPTRTDSDSDRLVQFCHGAPGIIPTLVKAYSYFNNDPKYLECAKYSSNVIWKYGLLTKGTGLCHGISGNTFSFLLIYKESNDLCFLYKAIAFVKLSTTKSFFKQLNIPDNPFSLFEGLGGLAWLLNDILNIYKYDKDYLKLINFPSF